MNEKLQSTVYLVNLPEGPWKKSQGIIILQSDIASVFDLYKHLREISALLQLLFSLQPPLSIHWCLCKAQKKAAEKKERLAPRGK